MVEMRGMLLVLLYISHSSASCGIQNTDTAATSEEGMVRSKEFPWVVSLQDSLYTHLAFGSILSEFWIISIASIFKNRKDTIAIVGIAKMDAKVIFHKEYPVNTIIIHEDFDNNTMTNNIALLKTDTAIQFNDLTGNHMTMSILRKISVKDMNLCPLRKIEKSGCGSHLEKEIDSVCLGDPGNPMMCQLQHLNVWVLRGILSPGGEECPGLFLYIRVEDYSDWITDKTKKTSPPLSSFHHWNNPIPFFNHFSEIAVTEKKYTGLSQVGLSQTFFPGQNGDTLQLWPVNNSRESPDSRAKGFRELSAAPDMAVQPMYYDYYGGEAGENGALSGQNRFHRPQEIILFFFVLVFFCSGI